MQIMLTARFLSCQRLTFASFASIGLRPWPGGQDSGKLQWTCEECKEEGFLEMVQKTDQELSSKGYKTIAPCLNCLLRVIQWGSDCIARPLRQLGTTHGMPESSISLVTSVHLFFDIRSVYHTVSHYCNVLGALLTVDGC